MQGTRNYYIHYVVDSDLDMVGFIDLDWDEYILDRKSNLDYVFMYGGGPIFGQAKSRQQFPYL